MLRGTGTVIPDSSPVPQFSLPVPKGGGSWRSVPRARPTPPHVTSGPAPAAGPRTAWPAPPPSGPSGGTARTTSRSSPPAPACPRPPPHRSPRRPGTARRCRRPRPPRRRRPGAGPARRGPGPGPGPGAGVGRTAIGRVIRAGAVGGAAKARLASGAGGCTAAPMVRQATPRAARRADAHLRAEGLGEGRGGKPLDGGIWDVAGHAVDCTWAQGGLRGRGTAVPRSGQRTIIPRPGGGGGAGGRRRGRVTTTTPGPRLRDTAREGGGGGAEWRPGLLRMTHPPPPATHITKLFPRKKTYQRRSISGTQSLVWPSDPSPPPRYRSRSPLSRDLAAPPPPATGPAMGLREGGPALEGPDGAMAEGQQETAHGPRRSVRTVRPTAHTRGCGCVEGPLAPAPKGGSCSARPPPPRPRAPRQSLSCVTEGWALSKGEGGTLPLPPPPQGRDKIAEQIKSYPSQTRTGIAAKTAQRKQKKIWTGLNHRVVVQSLGMATKDSADQWWFCKKVCGTCCFCVRTGTGCTAAELQRRCTAAAWVRTGASLLQW